VDGHAPAARDVADDLVARDGRQHSARVARRSLSPFTRMRPPAERQDAADCVPEGRDTRRGAAGASVASGEEAGRRPA